MDGRIVVAQDRLDRGSTKLDGWVEAILSLKTLAINPGSGEPGEMEAHADHA